MTPGAHPGFVTRTSLLVLVWGLFGCEGPDAFNCVEDAQCGEGGICEVNGACSFEDEACGSGRRYGEFAPQGIAGACVPGEEPVIEPEPLGGETVCGREATCEACLTCALFEGPCAASIWACSAEASCSEGVTCGQTCLLTGVCDDCCTSAAATHAETIDDINTCVLSECAALCGSERVPVCEG